MRWPRGELPNVDSLIVILGAIRRRSAHTVAPPLPLFCPRPDAHGIIVTMIHLIGFEYMTTLKMEDFDVVGPKI